jgi:hypothetical protein
MSCLAFEVGLELTSRTVPQVMVISSEGMFQAYNIDLENGGECSLMKEFSYVSTEYQSQIANKTD